MVGCERHRAPPERYFAIFDKFGGATLTRETIGMIVACADILCVLVFFFAIWFLKSSTELAVEEFKDQSLEIREFALELTNLPPRSFYKHEKSLRSMLWNHLVKVTHNEE